jgi:N-acetylated-alpha-linked acidic dipeptidase
LRKEFGGLVNHERHGEGLKEEEKHMIRIPAATYKLEALAREEVSRENLQKNVENLCSIGERLAGTPQEVKACDYIVSRLSEYGIKAQVYTFEGYVSHPIREKFSIFFPETRTFTCLTVSFSMSTPPSGISAEIVHGGDGNEKDYEGLEVRGKFVLIDKLPIPDRVVAAVKHGAAGVIAMSERHNIQRLIVTPVWGTPSLEDKDKIPRIPVVSVNAEDGKYLRSLARAGTLKGTIATEVWEGWKTLHLPVAEINGKSSELILIGAHYCTWFTGATDNTAGNCAILELARILKEHENSLKRTVRVAWWPGHSHGRYAGSTWYADTFWQDLYDNGVVYFNVDATSYRGSSIYVTKWQMGEIAEFNQQCVKELAGGSADAQTLGVSAFGKRAGKYTSPARAGREGDQSFWGIGLTSMGASSTLPPGHPDRLSGGGPWWWHAAEDTLDKMDSAVLAQTTRMYVSMILRLATMPILPFNFAAVAQDYLDALREYEEEAGAFLLLRPLVENVKVLQQKAEALDRKIASLPEDDPASKEVNRLFLRLARTLNPTCYTSVPPFDQQPALSTRLVPDLGPSLQLKKMNPDSSDFKFLATGLKRKINKVNFSVLTAARMIDSWLG